MLLQKKTDDRSPQQDAQDDEPETLCIEHLCFTVQLQIICVIDVINARACYRSTSLITY